MSFGRNPHVAKAEASEQKAQIARDERAGQQAWLEAARLWERAADRETDDKRRAQYGERAEAARARAETQPPATPDSPPPKGTPSSLLN
jgi:succinate dehydrogenase/fumarate reductase flavoprotein subunit